jgi:hypothetical protein
LKGCSASSSAAWSGVYRHCGEQHLQCYLDEFSFRYNNRVRLGVHDEARARIAAYGMNYKRLNIGGLGVA